MKLTSKTGVKKLPVNTKLLWCNDYNQSVPEGGTLWHEMNR